MKESLFITWKKEKLAAVIDYPENIQLGRKYSLFIICHGFIGSKMGVDRLFVKTAQQLNQDQYIVLRFDYSGCGESSGDYGNTGLHDLIDQTRTVIDFAHQLQQVDQSQITLLGHSLGGATAALTAAQDHRIKRLILWSSVAYPYEDIKRIVGREKVQALQKDMTIDYLGYPLTKSFFDSLTGYQPMQAVVEFSGDVLIVHGTGDEDIPTSYAKEYEKVLAKRFSGTVLRYEVDGANHTFSRFDHFSELIGVTRSWIENTLYHCRFSSFYHK
ncbi:alpha/beta fold hydrolase [Bacillus sp. V3B]|uniref:alpha/beta hydrolase n=1 Tax=Bacillus sp. V3B TaxID=2804915 RepID=UPI00210B6BFB|nr:alpha/beta hydrolase [Bacillus sp. V3B]MCQ6276201.1 alpha/beta fold hydrolase [Bacillus sp. V3B]